MGIQRSVEKATLTQGEWLDQEQVVDLRIDVLMRRSLMK